MAHLTERGVYTPARQSSSVDLCTNESPARHTTQPQHSARQGKVHHAQWVYHREGGRRESQCDVRLFVRAPLLQTDTSPTVLRKGHRTIEPQVQLTMRATFYSSLMLVRQAMGPYIYEVSYSGSARG
jgi:hypothetical protein